MVPKRGYTEGAARDVDMAFVAKAPSTWNEKGMCLVPLASQAVRSQKIRDCMRTTRAIQVQGACSRNTLVTRT